MIPLSLRLRNFMSYGEGVPPLDFEPFRLACLCGDNGHGKSALLDAITWALWGRSRARSEDDLIQLGKTDVEVEFSFALGTERYCVLRKRTRRRRVSVPTLELQIWDGQGYRALTDESVSATQKTLNALLRIDYETFINSAFVLQGRADEFTLKTATERKVLLSDLLGLGRFDELADRARLAARDAATRLSAVKAAIELLDKQIERRPEYEAQVSAAEQMIATADLRRRAAEAELALWRQQETAVRNQSETLERLRQTEVDARKDIAELERRHEDEQGTVKRFESILAEESRIRDDAARLVQARAQEEALATRASERVALIEEQRALRDLLERMSGPLRTQAAAARAELARLRGLIERRASLELEIAAAKKEVEAASRLETRRTDLRTLVDTRRAEIRAVEETNVRLMAEMKELRARIAMLDTAGARCPICDGTLDATARVTVHQRLEADGKARAASYRANEGRVRELEVEHKKAAAEITELEAQLAGRPAPEGRLASLTKEREAADAAVAAEPAAVALIAEIELSLTTGSFAPAETARWAEIEQRLADLDYDSPGHVALRAEIARLAGADARLVELETVAGAIGQARERAAGTESLLHRHRLAMKANRVEIERLEGEARRTAEIAEGLRAASLELDAAIDEGNRAAEARGRAQQSIDACDYLVTQRAERSSEAASLAEDRQAFQELGVAFGPNGIPAMIIEEVIPEIETEANDLLARLTDGQLNLALETQREARVGSNVIETLDIRISDGYGTRSYEMYSGGEAFRVNFALRIALSKLLARRAGTQLQMLFIDEGFGTQDATGRDRLVEALTAVADDFEKILVVTHIQELKDAFPYRIDVVKGPEGSQIVGASPADD